MRRDVLASRPRMPGPADDPKLVVRERLPDEIAWISARPQRAEDEIKVACTQACLQRFCRSLHGRDAQSGMLLHHVGDRNRAARGCARASVRPTVTVPCVIPRSDAMSATAWRISARARFNRKRERSSRCRRHHASCRSLEERDADAVLELADCHAHGRLGDAEAFGNGRHVVLLGQRDECTNASFMGQHAEYRGIAHAALLEEGSDARCGRAASPHAPAARARGARDRTPSGAFPRATFEQLECRARIRACEWSGKPRTACETGRRLPYSRCPDRQPRGILASGAAQAASPFAAAGAWDGRRIQTGTAILSCDKHFR